MGFKICLMILSQQNVVSFEIKWRNFHWCQWVFVFFRVLKKKIEGRKLSDMNVCLFVDSFKPSLESQNNGRSASVSLHRSASLCLRLPVIFTSCTWHFDIVANELQAFSIKSQFLKERRNLLWNWWLRRWHFLVCLWLQWIQCTVAIISWIIQHVQLAVLTSEPIVLEPKWNLEFRFNDPLPVWEGNWMLNSEWFFCRRRGCLSWFRE